MEKIILLIVKFGPALWVFIKETLFKLEDRKYFLRNKFQLATLFTMILSTIVLVVVYEGYNAHAAESSRKDKEMIRLEKEVSELQVEVDQLRDDICPPFLPIEEMKKIISESEKKVRDKIASQPQTSEKTQDERLSE